MTRAYRLITDEGDVETHGDDNHLTQGLPFYTSPRCLNWTLDSEPALVGGFPHPEPAIPFSTLSAVSHPTSGSDDVASGSRHVTSGPMTSVCARDPTRSAVSVAMTISRPIRGRLLSTNQKPEQGVYANYRGKFCYVGPIYYFGMYQNPHDQANC